MRRSLARSIDGVHDSSWIRREVQDAQQESQRLQEKGDEYLQDMDRIVAARDALADADIDSEELDGHLTELDQMLHDAEQELESEVITEMEDNEALMLELQEMAEDAASEHDAILTEIDTNTKVTGHELADVTKDIDSEGQALKDAAREAADALSAQIEQASALQRNARMRSIRRGR